MVKRLSSPWRSLFMWSRRLFTRRRPSFSRPLPTITHLPIEAGITDGPCAVDLRAHLVPALPRLRRHPWAWGTALLLHVLVIAALLLIHEPPPVLNLQDQPSINLVLQNGGTGAVTSAPPSQYHDMMQQAKAPPPSASSAAAAMQDEVQMPPIPLSELPRPQPQPHPRAAQRSSSMQTVAAQHGYVLVNGMSYGNVSPVAPPAPPKPRGINFAVPASSWQAKSSSTFTVQGDPGADWGLQKWVEDHAYYPQAAIEQGQQGTAVVSFTVDRYGHVTDVKLVSSSHSPFLDQALYQLFKDNRLPPFPKDAKSDHVHVVYTMHYILVP